MSEKITLVDSSGAEIFHFIYKKALNMLKLTYKN